MSPVPDVTPEDIILSSASITTELNVISSSDEFDHNEQVMDLGLVSSFFNRFDGFFSFLVL
jgi:hypothetical protein